jgi:hypothetical protein
MLTRNGIASIGLGPTHFGLQDAGTAYLRNVDNTNQVRKTQRPNSRISISSGLPRKHKISEFSTIQEETYEGMRDLATLRITEFLVLSIVWYSKNKRKLYENWVCFRPQVRSG